MVVMNSATVGWICVAHRCAPPFSCPLVPHPSHHHMALIDHCNGIWLLLWLLLVTTRRAGPFPSVTKAGAVSTVSDGDLLRVCPYKRRTKQCIKGRGCAPASQRSYNA